MVKLLCAIAFIFAFALLPEFRYTLFHAFRVMHNAIIDGYKYIKFKRWNECGEYGKYHNIP